MLTPEFDPPSSIVMSVGVGPFAQFLRPESRLVLMIEGQNLDRLSQALMPPKSAIAILIASTPGAR